MAGRKGAAWVQNAGENPPASVSDLVEAAVTVYAESELDTDHLADPFLASLAAAGGRPDLALARVEAIPYPERKGVAAASAAVAAPTGDAGPLMDAARAAIARDDNEAGARAVALGALALALERGGDGSGAADAAREAEAWVPNAKWGPNQATGGLARWRLGRGEADAACALLAGCGGGVGADPRGFARRVMIGLGRLGAYGGARAFDANPYLRPWWPARDEMLAAGAADALVGWVAGAPGDGDDARAVIVYAAAVGDTALALRAYATIPSSRTFPRLLPLPALARLDPNAARSALDAVREAESDAPEFVETLVALGELDAARDHVRSLALDDALRALHGAAPEVVDEALAAWLADQSGGDPTEEAGRLGLLAVHAWRSGDREVSRARFDAQLDQAVATAPDSRWASFGDSVRDRLATGDVPFAAAVVAKAPVALRAGIVLEILAHQARAGDRGGMVACLRRLQLHARHVLRASFDVEFSGVFHDVLRVVDDHVDPGGADVPVPRP